MKEILKHIQSFKTDQHFTDFARRNYGLEMVWYLKIAEDDDLEVSITDLHKSLSEPKPTLVALRDFISFLETKNRIIVKSSGTKKNRKSVKLSPKVSAMCDFFVARLYADIQSSDYDYEGMSRASAHFAQNDG